VTYKCLGNELFVITPENLDFLAVLALLGATKDRFNSHEIMSYSPIPPGPAATGTTIGYVLRRGGSIRPGES